MNRLQKKCLIASLSFHGLLILVLLFGAALMPEPQESTFKPITLYDPSKISDLPTSGSGTETPTPPAAPPAQPKTQPQSQPQTQPAPPAPKPPVEPRRSEPTKVTEEPVNTRIADKPQDHWYNIKSWVTSEPAPKPDVSNDETSDKPTKHKIVLTSTDVKKTARSRDEAVKAAADGEAKANQRRTAMAIASSLHSLSSDLSKGSSVSIPTDFGTSGQASVNYNDLIGTIYYNAWIVPTDLGDTTSTVIVKVTVARDGRVVSSHITQSSGNATLDRSVENALENVKFIEAFPPSFKEDERTFPIQFDPRNHRST